MKKIILALILILTLSVMLVSCANDTATNSDATTDTTKNIITTTFYQYDFVQNILGDTDTITLTLLNDTGTDIHSFEPTTKDIVDILNCDLFVFNGGVSENWVYDIINSSENKNLNYLELMSYVDTKNIQIVEGMEVDDHDHDHEGEIDEDDHDHESEIDEDDHESEIDELDEHIWLSIKNSIELVNVLTDAICDIDSENTDIYRENAQNYINQLEQLDASYAQVVNDATNNIIVVADRFPYRYLVDDYGIEYCAAFDGCSSETNASFSTITFLATKLDENNLHYVITTENSTQDIAKSVISATTQKDQEILELNSMQTISLDDINNGVNYIDLMTQNLETLKLALN